MDLVENQQKIDIDDVVRRTMAELKVKMLSSELSINGLSIQLTTSTTGQGGTRFWFVCPQCKGRVGVIFSTGACRKCSGLDYRAHRYSRMIEAQTNKTQNPY